MYEYYALLRQRHRYPVLPLAVFPVARGSGRDTYAESVLGEEVLRFHYHLIALREVPAGGLPPENPVTHALLPLLRGRPASPVEVRWQAYLGITRTVGEMDRRAVLAGFVDSYVPLTGAELAELRARPIMPERRERCHCWCRTS